MLNMFFGCCIAAWSPIHIGNGQQWISTLWPWSWWHPHWAGRLCVVISKDWTRNVSSNPLWDEQTNSNVVCLFPVI